MRLSVTTPRGSMVDTDVEEVTAPGELGEFGVLPGHEPLMSALKPGVLIYRTKEHAGVMAVSSGFLQVAPKAGQADTAHDQVLVLVERALAVAGIDRPAAE